MYSILYLISILYIVTALPKDEKQDRVFERELSEKQHFENEIHNAEYDHEAFLGEEAKIFDQLTPDESKRRLGIIVDRIDNNKDGFVSREELRDWIKFTQRKYIVDDIERQWKQYNPQGDESLAWDTYQKLQYGFLDSLDSTSETDDEIVSYKTMLKRDKRRWQMADKNGDDALTKEEFSLFLHPEEDEYMKDVLIQETMEDIDKNNDGKVSLEEYIGDMYSVDENEEPDWVKSEREQFNTYRDKDGDGFMDVEEVKNWVLPPDFDHSEAEARHLIYETDSDADEQLTKDEILNKYDVFVGSQATNFGDSLTKHDEF